MSETLSSGLTLVIPSQGDNNWSQSIKDNCFQPISEHGHTGSGDGVQITTDAIANLAVTSGKIADGAIGEIKLAINSVTEDKIFNGQVSTNKLANLAVTAAKIANTTITAAQLASDAVTTAKILDLNVTTGKLADLAVTTAKIADGAVTEAKLDADAATRSTLLASFEFLVTNGTGSAISELLHCMPKACKVTHLSAAIATLLGVAQPVTGGSFDCVLYKNGATTSQLINITTGEVLESGAITAQSYAADDTIGAAINRGGVTLTNSPATVIVNVWGHFTE